MARPRKKSIDWYRMDSSWRNDKKMKLLMARHGRLGVALYQDIVTECYRDEGYFFVADTAGIDLLLLEYGHSALDARAIIESCLELNLFDGNTYKKHAVLTSKRIQEEYSFAKTNNRAHNSLLMSDSLYNLSETIVCEGENYSYGNEPNEETPVIPQDCVLPTNLPNHTNLTNQESIRARTRFTPPSVDEVEEYRKERKSTIDPHRFVDFYASKNWMVGKNKMKDWKAAFRGWESRKQQPTNFVSDTVTDDYIQKLKEYE